MKPIFCGNLDFDARQSDVDRLFRKYGRVDRVDMKSGKISLLFLVAIYSIVVLYSIVFFSVGPTFLLVS